MGRGSGAGSGFTTVFRPPSYQPSFEGRSRNLTFTVCNFAFILLAPFTLSNFSNLRLLFPPAALQQLLQGTFYVKQSLF